LPKARLYSISAVVAFAILSIATLSPLWRETGWPLSHDGEFFGMRTRIYAQHFAWFDLMPIWSSVDVYGFGSPMLAMYHKLFYFPAGGIALLTGSVKAGDVAALWLFLIAGGVGMLLTMRALGADRLFAAVAGICLITANYTVTDWLVRGAVAEASAAMVMPWVFLFLVKTIQSGRMAIGLGIALGLLWLGHSVLAYFTCVILAVTYLLLALFDAAPWSVIRPRTAWPAVVCFLALVGPFVLPMAILAPNYDLTRILKPNLQPRFQFVTPERYVWDTSWHFGRTQSGLTVQLDLAMLMLLGVAITVLCIQRFGSKGPIDVQPRRIMPFVLVLAIGGLLQLRASLPVYSWIPGGVFIQFPWRLLAVMTPALIVTALYLAERVLADDARAFAVGAAAAWMVASCGAFVPIQDTRIPFESQVSGVTFASFRDFEPRQAPPFAELQAKIADRWKEATCGYAAANAPGEEAPSLRFRVSCGRATELPLPLYASPFHMVTTRWAGRERSRPCSAIPDFPGVCGAVLPAADSTVDVKLPSMASIPGWAWRHLTGSSR
jgi:hypothetical protein